MTLVRRVARPLLAAQFITGGLDSVRNPKTKVPSAEKVGPSIAQKIPYLPEDPETLVRLNGAVMLGAGTMLALGRLPRLSALALAVSLVPTTLAGHRYWEEQDPQAKTLQKIQFTKNVGLLGGLLLAAVDTEGRPGVAWRTQRAARDARRAAKVASRSARREARLAAARLPGH